ncbi:5-bromo-4-chloroindolyl phosphate hydrolysis family protein [Abyssicoccus albus]|uniref:5-bromo-4-chloroindolyl phosphate hydrolysis family protein n=1 Tax=Abyssicoccus albus TaxID=1817405 RepID=UPI00097E2A0B|nr:5-bromo-4-chloroindolyl phosphate hydrolysis family protein [Abyssicoccus albus]AQL56212.1 hypothetical protein BVH56_04425 [Abyssicoccus albus]
MKKPVSNWVASFISVPVMIIVTMVSNTIIDVMFLGDMMVGVLFSLTTYLPTKLTLDQSFYKKIGLTKKEYRYVQKQLSNSRDEIRQLRQMFKNVRRLKDVKSLFTLYQTVNRINTIVKQDPKRFFLIENYYYAHLPSVIKMIHSYQQLILTPNKTAEDHQQIKKIQWSIDEMQRTLYADLKQVNKPDYNAYQIEEALMAQHRLTQGDHNEQ